ncbi:inositol hexakisphosphate and diphosphoinositol-pentakisphosphate kinase 2 isoform X1 [Hydra vulgaris]|uniref:inositol hexakisphosphate and diphosphoinositol-pentakisphosphate kinase 2 isoform X1 n=1 Tax=Hydra vulgaris TaxID=6087 RepID=UPI0032EA5A77
MDEVMHTDLFQERKFSVDETNKVSLEQRKNWKVKVGICAMSKKTKSSAMEEILRRLKFYHHLELITFSDQTILEVSVEEWPIVDALVSFYSTGFPLEKAVAYTKLRKPFVLNDLEVQDCLLDRRQVYKVLESARIETPRYAIFERDDNNQPVLGQEIIESDDIIIVNGVTFKKPFVEKPVDAEDHNVFIYYPSFAGGGCQILFRKNGNESSMHSPRSHIRRNGSFIYEDFMPTNGTDVKVYTVGGEYAHAEARKSPFLDGKVDRTKDGKEVRYPVILNRFEKTVAHKVCRAFKQTVCGFDLLRANGKSLVCDVNGFSFVKTSQKYYDDCAQLLAEIFLKNLVPPDQETAVAFKAEAEKKEMLENNIKPEKGLELRCLIAVMRHSDRTPKQKMKMIVSHRLFHDIFLKHGGLEDGCIKLKNPSHLHEMLDIFRRLDAESDPSLLSTEDRIKLNKMKSVLEMYGHFNGINRKIQLKSMSDKRNIGIISKLRGRNKVEQQKEGEENRLILIVKWGGELTPFGRKQAEDLGRAYRCLYPEGSAIPGGGLLRLHSTYRHDLKIYSSDEGRVKMTAASFAKGLLDLEGELVPILVSLVKNDKYVTGILDTPPSISANMQRVKSQIHDKLRSKEDFTEEDIANFTTSKNGAIAQAMRSVKNPYKKCEKVYRLVCVVVEQIKQMCMQEVESKCYYGEGLNHLKHRWEKLQKDFKNGNEFDMSLIPDIYDCVKYDYLHNTSINLQKLPELYADTKSLADIVIPQEYGITSEDKIKISREICSDLLLKIKSDLNSNVIPQGNNLDPFALRDIDSPNNHVRTRLYITSESHVHSLVNALKEGKLFKGSEDSMSKQALAILNNTAELNYLTQIVIMKYEDLKVDPQSDERFRIEILFSSGVKCPVTPDDVLKLHEESKSNNCEYIIKKFVEEDSVLLEMACDEQKAAELKQKAKTKVFAELRRGGNIIDSFPSGPRIRPRRGSGIVPSFEPSSIITTEYRVPFDEVLEMLPNLHPLQVLHSCLRQKQLNYFIDHITEGYKNEQLSAWKKKK